MNGVVYIEKEMKLFEVKKPLLNQKMKNDICGEKKTPTDKPESQVCFNTQQI